MRTWNDYKDHVKAIDEVNRQEMETIEEQAAIITALITKRTALGISQRGLADMDKAIANFKGGNVSEAIDLADFQ